MADHEQQIKDSVADSVRSAAKEGLDKAATTELIRNKLREAVDHDSIVQYLGVNEDDGDFTAVVSVEGRRGDIAVEGEL